ncbi:nuclear transport factor 2 family protein [Nocardia vinacea]|uniref:nuclear transport factor 2 family protein n=1 Tax=Nocardia vinacea TaxID=96468 RepID=UPI0002F024B1|nr:nuclear transport factor 2 family protein [Nocardia vinacea]
MARADDIEEIRQLTYKYFWGWDVDDIDAATEVFTPDGVNDESRLGSYVVRGHAELRANFAKYRPMMTHSFHLVGNHIIEFDDDDHAHGTNYFDGVAVLQDGSEIGGKHYFADTYVRTAAGWRIATRIVHPLMPIPGSPWEDSVPWDNV